MINYLRKFNSLFGIFLVIIFLSLCKFLENILREILRYFEKLLHYFLYAGGGYIELFYEKLFIEVLATFFWCSASLYIPIYLNKKYFNFKTRKFIYKKKVISY